MRYAQRWFARCARKVGGWFFCWRSFVFKSGFFCPPFLSVALTALPNHTSPPRAAPSEDYFHAGGLGARLFREGRQTEDAQAEQKKKTMKTTSQKNNSGLVSRSAQSSSPTPAPEAQSAVAPKQDTRLPIDTEERKKNRTMPTDKVLALLHTVNPDLFNLAEVVGKWIWVSFKEQPAATLRQQLAQLGFHWNRERQAWQHPCGAFRLRGAGDPHEKYPTYYPGDQKPA